MEIIFDEERKPENPLIEKMATAGRLCLLKENIPEDRVEISVSFVSPDEIRLLNKMYRGVDAITDVLSFPQFEVLDEIPKDGAFSLGDIVICSEQALLQADEFGHSAERELIYLFVHSLAHLMGYDHMNEEEKAEMRGFEEEIMEQLNLQR